MFKPIEFYTTSAERNFPDGQITVYNRITKIFEEVKRRNSKIFEAKFFPDAIGPVKPIINEILPSVFQFQQKLSMGYPR